MRNSLDKLRRATASVFAAIIVAAALSGCASHSDAPSPALHASTAASDGHLIASDPAESKAERDRLAALYQSRTSNTAIGDYPIGPGDVLQVSVPMIAELKDREVRVAGDGLINLPLIGMVQAGGLTEEGLHRALAKRLRKYMRHPQVEVFVKEYRSREVAVVGAVKTPGLLTLSSPADTILDMLTRAGGVTDAAADEIMLIPAPPATTSAMPPLRNGIVPVAMASGTDGAGSRPGLNAESANADGVNAILRSMPPTAHPLSIALRSTSLTGAGKYLTMPVRPGDVIVVPGGGEVMVVGWVQYPGHFKVGSGLSALGAIGAAGGPMYAAKTDTVKLIRTSKDGSKETIALDIDKISNGTDPDIPVEANDVIDVDYSGWKIGPYFFYNVLTHMGYGVMPPMP